MQIEYGTYRTKIDVTHICYKHPVKIGSIITIPSGDFNRVRLFTDPAYGIQKSLFITDGGNTLEYSSLLTIKLDLDANKVYTMSDVDIDNKLANIHDKIVLNYGSMNDELTEQKMIVRYLTGNEKVLELGSNIGRSSLVIATILEEHQNNNFVTLECDLYTFNQLREHRAINNGQFHIEASALSKRKMIQKDWNTICSDTLFDGFQWISTITFDEINAKYQIKFDTLMLDCEGSFYYILVDMPEILDNIKLIIMENDYKTASDYEFVYKTLVEHGFYIDYMEPLNCNMDPPCKNNFYEVWKRSESNEIRHIMR